MPQQRFQLESLTLDINKPEPLFRQLENRLREAIWCGHLKSGERLPSSRNLAKKLGIARNTVVNAYEQLAIEGFVVSRKGSGTHVNHRFPPQPPTRSSAQQVVNAPPKITLSERVYRLHQLGFSGSLTNDTPPRPFRAHTTALKEFPSEIWAQLTTRILRHQNQDLLSNCHPCGYLPLREAIADYLGAERSMHVNPEQIMITAGAQQGIELLAKALVNTGDLVCFEEPGYTPALATFAMAGANTLSIPVDEQGFNINELIKQKEKVKLVYLTPASHFPLGMALTQTRRQALLQWAEQHDTLIIEDDYNGEYRYRGRPLPTLFSMSPKGHVLYVGSFSKLLFPALRLGFIVVPKTLIDPLSTLRWLLDRHSPPLEQAVLADFINQGHFARHLRRMRMLYSERQHALIQASEKHLANIIDVPALDGGLHLVGWLRQNVRLTNLLNAATKAQIELMATSLFYTSVPNQASVILGYAPYSTEEIERGIIALRDAYHAETKT